MGTSRSHMGWSALAVAVLLSSAFFPGCGRTPGLREDRAREEQDDFERRFNLEAGPEDVQGGERDTPTCPFEAEREVLYYQGPGHDASLHRLDLYLPQGVNSFPSLVFVPGGPWKYGDKGDKAGTSRALAEALAVQGIGVASINDRLFPQVMHPEQVRGVARAFSWVQTNISR